MVVSEAVPLGELAHAIARIHPAVHAAATGIGEDPDDVFDALFTPSATLHWVGDEGFVVLTAVDEDVLLVWVAAAFTGAISDLSAALDGVAELARRYGFKELQFRTARQGWERVAPPLGFRPVEVTYARSL